MSPANLRAAKRLCEAAKIILAAKDDTFKVVCVYDLKPVDDKNPKVHNMPQELYFTVHSKLMADKKWLKLCLIQASGDETGWLIDDLKFKEVSSKEKEEVITQVRKVLA